MRKDIEVLNELEGILWQELKESFSYRCQGIPKDRIPALWDAYRQTVLNKMEEDDE